MATRSTSATASASPIRDIAWFAISDEPVSFGRLARFFRDSLGCRNALYLDGGVSSLWDRPAGRRDSYSRLGPLVAVFERSSDAAVRERDSMKRAAAPVEFARPAVAPNGTERRGRNPRLSQSCCCLTRAARLGRRRNRLACGPGARAPFPLDGRPGRSGAPRPSRSTSGRRSPPSIAIAPSGRSGSSGSALRPEAAQLVRLLGPAATPELRPRSPRRKAAIPRRLTRADLLLSRAYADYAGPIIARPPTNRMRYIDAGRRSGAALGARRPRGRRRVPVSPPISRRSSGSIPVYDGLKRGLAAYRARWSRLPQARLPARPSEAALRQRLGGNSLARLPGASTAFPPAAAPIRRPIAALNRGAAHYERLIGSNIERARAIPARRDGRYILVDTASARLWMIEDGRIRDSMRVVVGKRAMPTPLMAGLIRYAVLNPYWNLPPDLIRERARKRRPRRDRAPSGSQVLSDWTPQARAARSAPGRLARGRRRPPPRQPAPDARGRTT